VKICNLPSDNNIERLYRIRIQRFKIRKLIFEILKLQQESPDSHHFEENLRRCIYVGCCVVGFIKFMTV
jgi:hypothetical protein